MSNFGDHFLLVLSDNTILSCGSNLTGELGLNDLIGKNEFTKINITLNSNIKQISCKAAGTVILLDDGTVYSFGDNGNLYPYPLRKGTLGLGFAFDKAGAIKSPTEIVELKTANKVIQIACGVQHILFLLNDGTVKGVCSDPSYGELAGADISTVNGIPIALPNITNVKQIACGNNHSVILLNDGNVFTFGKNDYGQLGYKDDLAIHDEFTPYNIGLTNVKQIACGNNHTLFLLDDNTIKACGHNYSGQLGINEYANYHYDICDVAAFGNAKILQLACGNFHSFVLFADGTVWGFGYNGYGQLGLDDLVDRKTPQKVPNVNTAIQISCSANSTFILLNNGTVISSGNNDSGQLGLSDVISRQKFTPIININRVTYMPGFVIREDNYIREFHSFHSLLFLDKQIYMAAGPNDYGQLGLNDNVQRPTYTQITFFNNMKIKQLSCGMSYSCVLTGDGTAHTFGINQYGTLAQGNTIDVNTPTLINNIDYVQQVSCGFDHILFLLKDNTVKCAGYNYFGQLGTKNNINITTPTTIPNLESVMQVSSGHGFSAVVMKSGKVKTFGRNTYGQLGHNNTIYANEPTEIAGLENVKEVKCGGNHIAFLLNNGKIMMCGNNEYGQLGQNNKTDLHFPKIVALTDTVIMISCGTSHTLVLTEKNEVFGFGNNKFMQTNFNALPANVLNPINIGLQNIIQIRCYGNSSTVLNNDGTCFAFGQNYDGRLGLTTTTIVDSGIVPVIKDVLFLPEILSDEYYKMMMFFFMIRQDLIYYYDRYRGCHDQTFTLANKEKFQFYKC